MTLEKHREVFDAEQSLGRYSPDGRKPLLGLSRDALRAELEALGLPAFRAKQLWHWIYHRGVSDFHEMTTLAKGVRQQLAAHFVIPRAEVTREHVSEDGTVKWLLRFPDGREVETVYIPDRDRGTLCVSSQIGCTLTCAFCHTGTQKLVRNLDSAEILAQVLQCRDYLGEWPSPKDGRRLSNIVMMGMGEPLYNYDNVAQALSIVMDGDGLALSKRRITLSTSGVVPQMHQCGEELGVNLAVSLHATRDDVRDRLVPLNRKYKIDQLLDACRRYPGTNNARRITFEYVMLKDVNDSLEEAHELVRLLEGIPAKVNLIPFNPWPGTSFECSDDPQIEAFSDVLADAGLAAPVRRPRGRDIGAACGQLKSQSQRERAAQRRRQQPTAAAAAAPAEAETGAGAVDYAPVHAD